MHATRYNVGSLTSSVSYWMSCAVLIFERKQSFFMKNKHKDRTVFIFFYSERNIHGFTVLNNVLQLH